MTKKKRSFNAGFLRVVFKRFFLGGFIRFLKLYKLFKQYDGYSI